MIDYFHAFIPIIGLIINVSAQVLGSRNVSQLTLLKSVILGFAVGCIGVFTLEYYLWSFWPMSMQEVLLRGMTNFLIYAALGYCYFHFINLGETARRIRILRELYEAPDGLSLEGILERYNAKHIVGMRLRRLIHNGQIVEQDGRYYIGSPVMLFIARSITLLKVVILKKKSEFD